MAQALLHTRAQTRAWAQRARVCTDTNTKTRRASYVHVRARERARARAARARAAGLAHMVRAAGLYSNHCCRPFGSGRRGFALVPRCREGSMPGQLRARCSNVVFFQSGPVRKTCLFKSSSRSDSGNTPLELRRGKSVPGRLRVREGRRQAQEQRGREPARGRPRAHGARPCHATPRQSRHVTNPTQSHPMPRHGTARHATPRQSRHVTSCPDMYCRTASRRIASTEVNR